ncbi:MAG TPA: LytR C-terminal domain-containing protein [Euzebya sp.]|nr:LytR C-terminal domain-containing protein [Euzebya sp.]
MDDFEDDFEPGGTYGDAPAQSSIAAPLIRALLAAAVAFGIYALVFSNGGDTDDLALTDDQVTAVPSPIVPVAPTTLPTAAEPTSEPTVQPTASATATPAGQVGAGVSAQVIAGANTTADQVADAVSALRELGYDVTESGISPNPYPETTVFATAGEEAQAEALTTADPRFTTVGENPGNLSSEIQIHVLVGEDWPTGEDAAPTDGATEG